MKFVCRLFAKLFNSIQFASPRFGFVFSRYFVWPADSRQSSDIIHIYEWTGICIPYTSTRCGTVHQLVHQFVDSKCTTLRLENVLTGWAYCFRSKWQQLLGKICLKHAVCLKYAH